MTIHACCTPLLLAGLALAMMGCASEKSNYPPTVPVEGEVLYEGQPLEGAMIMLLRDNGKGAVGRTDAAGHFQLSTFIPNDGAQVDQYQVQIVKYAQHDSELPDGVTPPLKSLIPKRYSNAKSSGLTASVTEDGENFFRFELE
ncbi:hypothetical protein [Bremerella alba]|uniref:Carboxypeptidase regulatory-like domain-containing protein n=1 Tax=Bremerella alba TaxID=980252 RepID=A0A7V8V2D9_9BACT|nr:hypothetical protein [Bremerella alba]MBA2113531.1 hypothetical protein [Bremerella alba]